MFRLGHLSDVHLGPVPNLRPGDYVTKRLVGYANWRRVRSRSAAADMLERIVADLRAQEPDHTAVTGDLTNIATREEFESARAWLEALGPPEISVPRPTRTLFSSARRSGNTASEK